MDCRIQKCTNNAETKTHPKAKLQNVPTFTQNRSHSCLFTFGNKNKNLYLSVVYMTIGWHQSSNGPIQIIGKTADNWPIPFIGASLTTTMTNCASSLWEGTKWSESLWAICSSEVRAYVYTASWGSWPTEACTWQLTVWQTGMSPVSWATWLKGALCWQAMCSARENNQWTTEYPRCLHAESYRWYLKPHYNAILYTVIF